MPKKRKRIAIFVDGNNFRHGLRTLLKAEQIDWPTFIQEIERDYDISQVNYYIGKLTHPLFDKEKVQEQQKMLQSLKKANVATFLGYFNDDKNEKGVDVQIALDLAIGAVKNHFDVALLISGDGDLKNAVKIAQTYKVRVILGYIAGTRSARYRISWILKDISDSQVALNAQVKKAHEVWEEKNPSSKKTAKKSAPAGSKKKETKKTPLKKNSSKNKNVSEVLVFF